MKIIDLLKRESLSLSFEVFPPKTDTAFESVRTATEEIAKLHPSFMSVTYGAGGGTSKYTLDIAKRIKQQYDVPSLAHLTCVSSTKETVHRRIDDMKAAGIQNVMALRGDIPAELQNADRSYWYYHHATQLVRELKESGADFCIGGACYPEIHHRCFWIITCSIISFIKFVKQELPFRLFRVLCQLQMRIKWSVPLSSQVLLCHNDLKAL